MDKVCATARHVYILERMNDAAMAKGDKSK